LSFVTGHTDGGVSAAVVRLRKPGEVLPIRGYVADMGACPTHKAAIIRLYLEGLSTPEIAARSLHTKHSRTGDPRSEPPRSRPRRVPESRSGHPNKTHLP
jgi:hypothetical protein